MTDVKVPVKSGTTVPMLGVVVSNGQTVDLDYFMDHDYEDIRQAMEELPSIACWMEIQRSWAVRRTILNEGAWRRAKAAAYFALKNGGEFQARGFGEKPTEDALRHAVELDPNVIKAEQNIADYSRR